MKTNLIVASLCLAALAALAASPARAQRAGDTGVGVVLGAPTGVTGKLWLNGTRAVDAGLGWNAELTVYGDYLWHGWDVVPQPPQGKLPVYLGLGAQARAFHEAEFAVRTVAGIAYWLPRHPVELFLEVVPVFRLTRHEGVGIEAGAGVRCYFTAGK